MADRPLAVCSVGSSGALGVCLPIPEAGSVGGAPGQGWRIPQAFVTVTSDAIWRVAPIRFGVWCSVHRDEVRSLHVIGRGVAMHRVRHHRGRDRPQGCWRAAIGRRSACIAGMRSRPCRFGGSEIQLPRLERLAGDPCMDGQSGLFVCDQSGHSRCIADANANASALTV